ncbi:RSD1 [Cyberlindnera jadinii]|uniref:NAD(P)-binding protein n=1 Tax=Cyberlindnera jadinii (strain ATCC 18201 / CBS 1600 / BCRC 20928 / JCM 3617 / NBRC 0987 / NRRL Y-1542) TaxID=983966 RepID=A0A0H5CBI0_CYBJN|nr:NAD(P)-binding protein [Cyberlindnera jadinii NRRL Y-1542]ODV74644.1 NAD(P)-binding protein [Cyberlindnera jadinii NRRL Y-1542]CEP21689.1 RSD1 [Cyberlindnera jadinii]
MPSLFVIKEFALGLKPPAPTYLPKDYPDLKGKYVLITGTSAGVGCEAAKLLLLKNAHVVMVNRNLEKTAKVIDEIKKDLLKEEVTGEDIDSRITVVQADLADLTTIKPAATKVLDSVPQLDIVILNAGVMQPPNDSVTKQGYELQFGSNVIGHQLLIELITPAILKSADSNGKPRVVFLSSMAHLLSPANGGLSWDFKDASQSSSGLIYGQSKAGNIYQASSYGKKYADKGIATIAVHPGILNSELQRNYPGWLVAAIKPIAYPAVYGAYTELFAALSPLVGEKGPGFVGYVAAFGQFRDLREDIAKGCTDGTDDKLIDWIDKEIIQYK